MTATNRPSILVRDMNMVGCVRPSFGLTHPTMWAGVAGAVSACGVGLALTTLLSLPNPQTYSEIAP